MTISLDPTQDDFGEPSDDTTIDGIGQPTPFIHMTAHAQGGLGEVFRAIDPELHRTVAVKYLQERHSSNPAIRRRFLLEAEVTARLEHPGVVPMYRLFAAGARPSYAMRFVEGQTLAEAITTFHAGSHEQVSFRRLIQAFLQLCQTVAYAHSRGVIHRDLKPSNVILGQFGETLLVDWGLAKVVGRPEEARASGAGETLVTSAVDSNEPGHTIMGSAVGTPAYMSPEQAAGRWDVVAQATDIYSLGAVLYNVLTARAPLVDGNWPEMQQKIQRGDFPHPRQVNGDVDRSLEALCLKAMALNPSDRYASVEAMATDVEHWLADEPLTAYRDPVLTRARRWARRYRTAVSTGIVLLVAALMGLSVGTLLLERAWFATEGQRQVAVAAQAKSEALNRFLIDDLLKQADPSNNPLGDKITVRQLLDMAAEKLDGKTTLVSQPEVEAEVRAVIGHAYEYLLVYATAERQYRRGYEIRDRLWGPKNPETLALRNRLIFTIVNQDLRPEAEALALEALNNCETILGREHPQTGDAASNLAEVRLGQARFDEAVDLRRRASRIMNASQGPDDIQTLEIDNNLGVTLVSAGRPAEAVIILQSVIDRRRRTSPSYVEFGLNLGNLGGALTAAGQFAEAERTLQEAIPLCQDRLGKDHSGTFSARQLLCYTTEVQGRWDEAMKGYLEVLADRRLVATQKPYLGRTLASLARLSAKERNWPVAAKYLAELLLAAKPNPTQSIDNLTPLLTMALTEMSDPVLAEALLLECREILKVRLWTGDWLTTEITSRYGDCLRLNKKYAEAEPILLVSERDLHKAVNVPEWGVRAIHTRLAALYDDTNRPAEAAKWREKLGATSDMPAQTPPENR